MTFLARLSALAEVRLGEDAHMFHTDERNRYHQAPLAVVFPRSAAQISLIIKLCATQSPAVAVIAQGGNTGLVGGCAVLPNCPSIIVNLTRLEAQIEIDVINRTACVSAGVTLEALHHAAAQQGLMFPLTLASQNAATIGGNLSTNAGGTQVLRYGNMRDLCLGLEVILPNGEIWQALNTLRKNNTGYDLKHLFIGAEGTLGIITRAILKLYPATNHRLVALLAAPDFNSVLSSFKFLQQLFDNQLVAFEYISDAAMQLVCSQFNQQHPFANTQSQFALIELSSTLPLNQADLEDALQQLIESKTIENALIAQSEQHALDFWLLRENISAAQKRVGKNIKHDICLPISNLVDFNHAAQTALQERFPKIEPMIFGHIGDGNLHYNVSKGDAFDNADQLMAHETEINHIVYQCVQQFNGSISAEHGIGLLKRDLLSQTKTTVEINLMRSIKAQLDPLNIMNPHKVIP